MSSQDEEKLLTDIRLALQEDCMPEEALHWCSKNERQEFQKKIYTTWINSKISEAKSSPQVNDLYTDLRDGKNLIVLLQVLTGKNLRPVKGNMSLHHLNNLTLVLDTLREFKVKLVGINNQSILEGDKVTTLGLCWSIIYRFQVLEAVEAVGNSGSGGAEKALLSWVQNAVGSYDVMDVISFQPKYWKDGYALCSILHAFKPSLFNYSSLRKFDDAERLQYGIDTGHNNFNIKPLFTAEEDYLTLAVFTIIHGPYQLSNVTEKLKMFYSDKSDTSLALIEAVQEEVIEEAPDNFDVLDEKETMEAVNQILQKIEKVASKIKDTDESPLLLPLVETSMKDLDKHCENLRALKKDIDSIDIEPIRAEIEELKREKTIPDDEKQNTDTSYNNLELALKSLNEKFNSQQANATSNLIEQAEEQLSQFDKLFASFKVDESKVSEQLNTPTSSEDTNKAIKLAEDLISNLSGMQHLVKYASDLSETISQDPKINTDIGQELREHGKRSKQDYNDLLNKLRQDKSGLETLAKENQAKLKNQEFFWLSKLEAIHKWLEDTIKEFEEEKEPTEETLTSDIQKIGLTKDKLDGNWKNYQELGREWNEELCDKLQNELYADMMNDVRDDFNVLNKKLSEKKSRLSKMQKAKINQDLFDQWKKLYNAERHKLESFNIPKPPEIVTMNKANKWKQDLEVCEEQHKALAKLLDNLQKEKNRLFESNKLSTKSKQIIQQDIESLEALMETNGNKIRDSKLKALQMNEQLSNQESSLYKEWFDQFVEVEEQINEKRKISNDLLQGVDDPNQIRDYLADIGQLEETITEVIERGVEVSNSDVLSDGKKANIMSDVNNLKENKKELEDDTNKFNRKLRDIEKSQLSQWHDRLEALQALIKDMDKDLNKIKLQGNTKSALQQVQEIFDNINTNEDTVTDFHNDSQLLLDPESKLEDTSLTLVNDGVKTVQHDWESLKMRTDALSLSLQNLNDEENEISKTALAEWEGKARSIKQWLDTSENEHLLNREPPTDLLELENYNADFENLIFKLTTEEKLIDEKLEYGQHLLESNKIKDEDEKEKLKTQLTEFSQRKKDLNDKLLHLQNLLADTSKALHEQENNEYKAWVLASSKVKDDIEDYEKIGQEVVIKTGKDANMAINKQKKFLEELDEYKESVDNVLSMGSGLIEQKKLGARRSSEVRNDLKLIEQKWDILRNGGAVILERYQEVSSGFSSESNEKSEKLLKRIGVFDNWLELALQQLNFYQNSNDDVQFDDLLQREQGLKKLSADLESHSKELSDLQKVSAAFTSDDNNNIEKIEELEKNINELQGKWDGINDGIDSEFKKISNLINNILDSKKGPIETSLKKIKLKLIDLTERDLEKNDLNHSAKELVDAATELSKLSSPMKQLSRQTEALGDITLFLDNEKELLQQSLDDIIKEHKNCQSLLNEAKKRQREAIFEYFKKETEKCNATMKDLNKQQIDIDDDEDDLDILRDYLVVYNNILNDVKVHSFKLEELEQYAEDILSYGLMEVEDQVKIAQCINGSLKNVEQLKQACKTKENRAHAITVHILKSRQQAASQKIQKVDEVGTHFQPENIESFDNATEFLRSIKKCEDDLSKSVTDIEAIKNELQALQEANVLVESDITKLTHRSSALLNESIEVSEKLGILKRKIATSVRDFTIKKLDEFWGWLPIMQKRTNECNEVGPDLASVKRQLQQMQVISEETEKKSFRSVLAGDNQVVLECIPEELKEIESADKEWALINDWKNERTRTLERANNLWDEFKHNENDLLEYLRNNNKGEKAWNQLDLNDDKSVESSRNAFNEIMEGLEIRKPHVAKLERASEDLVKMISEDGPVQDNIRSRVADILDEWNKVVKKNIENSSKLNRFKNKLEELLINVISVRSWVNATNKAIGDFYGNTVEERVETLLQEVLKQDSLKGERREELQTVNRLNDDLNNDELTRSHFSVDDDITALNYDFKDAVNALGYFGTFRGKGYVFWRRIKEKVGDGADRTKQFFRKNDEVDGVLSDNE